jgi:nicotinate-nucleotide pyrophosphorylase (carboxylating)
MPNQSAQQDASAGAAEFDADAPGFESPEISALVRRALLEDLGLADEARFHGAWSAADLDQLLARDLASFHGVPREARATAILRAKSRGVVAGLAVYAHVFAVLDPSARTLFERRDGDQVGPGDVVARTSARARALLTAERTALNFVQRASGIATLTRRFVEAAANGGPAGVYDTRKTAPGLRRFDKAAVRAGGGRNHRMGLFDEAMLKDNHLDLSRVPADDVAARTAYVARVRAALGSAVRLHVEARDEDEAQAAIAGGADVVLLDNFAPAALRVVVERLRTRARLHGRSHVEFEASGGIDLSTVADFAASGVDRLSVGALTHSVTALDLSLGIEREEGAR